MEDGVDTAHCAYYIDLRANVSFHNIDAIEACEARYSACGEIVEDPDLIPMREKASHEMRPYEACPTCDQQGYRLDAAATAHLFCDVGLHATSERAGPRGTRACRLPGP